MEVSNGCFPLVFFVQGVKCSICGHTGKSRVFQMLKVRLFLPLWTPWMDDKLMLMRCTPCQNKPSGNVFRVQGFDNSNQALTNSVSKDAGLWSFTKMLRQKIFLDSPKEFADDPTARHLVAFGEALLHEMSIGFVVANAIALCVLN